MSNQAFPGKSILLIVGGGIAAYKSLHLVRLLRAQGVAVTTIMTAAGKRFIAPMSFAALTANKVYDDLFDLEDEAEMGHIELSRSADLIVVAPASADLIARMAAGLCSDLASTALLATDKPVLVAPAMNVRMWNHPATRRNMATLAADGIEVIGPDEGDMACGEHGPGRMSEPEVIAARVMERLAVAPAHPPATGDLSGRSVLITAGPTHEPIDPVRYIANRSSGRQGYALARAAHRLGARVFLVSGPVHLDIPPGVEVIPVETAQEMLAASVESLPCDLAICCAAVADWRIAEPAAGKLKKTAGASPPSLKLVANPDILKTLSSRQGDRPAIVVGFAAETGDVVDNAMAKLKAKGCDMIVANDVSAASGVMGGGRNTVHLVSAAGVESWPEMSKQEVADRLLARLAEQLSQAS